jgi:2-hydroxychromene-2-carboxylate isomerase
MDAFEIFGAEDAAAHLTALLGQVRPGEARLDSDGRPLLCPPVVTTRDRFDGMPMAGSTLVVFGAYGTPWSKPLERVLTGVRERHLIVWRHFPGPDAHPRAAMLALAAEAAAARSKFWTLTREMLRLRHDDPADLHAAMLRAGLDPERAIAAMQAGTGTERIVDDVASALASGVAYSPTLFVNGERYAGELEPDAVTAALENGKRGSARRADSRWNHP